MGRGEQKRQLEELRQALEDDVLREAFITEELALLQPHRPVCPPFSPSPAPPSSSTSCTAADRLAGAVCVGERRA